MNLSDANIEELDKKIEELKKENQRLEAELQYNLNKENDLKAQIETQKSITESWNQNKLANYQKILEEYERTGKINKAKVLNELQRPLETYNSSN